MERLELRIADHLDELGLEVWEAVTKEACMFMQASFLLALDDHRPETVQPKYALLFDGDRPVAALAGQILRVDAERAAPGGEPDGRLAKLAQAALEHVDIEVALWGNFLTWGHCGVAIAPGVEKGELWPRIAEAIYRARKADPALRAADVYLVLDVPPEQTEGAGHLAEHGFAAFETEPDMVLELGEDWTCFDDYLGTLKTKYRKASRKMDEELAEAGCELAVLDEVASHEEQLHALYEQVHERSPHRFVTLKPGTLPALAERLGSRFVCNVVKRQEELLGFSTVLIDGDDAIAYFVGHDVKANGPLPVYLRLLQEAIATALAHGCRRVVYGRTALEPKARIGAQAVPLVVYGRHKNRLLGSLISGFMQSITPHEEPPQRRPFKATPPSDGLPTRLA